MLICNGLCVILQPTTNFLQNCRQQDKDRHKKYEENTDYNGRTHRNGGWRAGVQLICCTEDK